jgi:hypothetical protein
MIEENLTLKMAGMKKLCFLVLVSCLVLFGCKPPGHDNPCRTQLLTTTPSPANGGTVAPSGQTRQDYSSRVTLTASPAAGYELSHWEGDIFGYGEDRLHSEGDLGKGVGREQLAIR